MRTSAWILLSPKSNEKCPYKRKAEGDLRLTEDKTHTESDVKMETKIGIMQPQVTKHLEPPEAGRGEEGFTPRAFRGSVADTAFGLLALRTVREYISFCCFKPASLW